MEIGTVRLINIEQEIQGAYLDYAMSVITARALPDVRDGLKPVQRRILYGMHDLGIRPGTAYKKSARIVGEVLGKYHPHGEAPVYDAMVRMAQDFSLRYPLVDGQGNYGSVDGDPPAAMRYTEARLAPIADEMLADIDRDTVDYTPNFDDTLKEPSVLPARLPNLLVNGSAGIAVGMATNIPPHNLGEIVDALTYVIDRCGTVVDAGVPFDVAWVRLLGSPVEPAALAAALKSLPAELATRLKTGPAERAAPEALGNALLNHVDEQLDVTPDQLMALVRGPDFPTAGTIIGVEGIKSAYTTGRGRITIRAKVRAEELRGGRQALVVTELPFQVNKATLQEKMAELIRDRRLEGISDVRDESDREGMRLVVELKRDAQPGQVLNQLYRYTAMQTAFSANVVALVDGQPRVLTLKMALLQYVAFRRSVVTRRTQHELGRARARAHILEGLRIALDNLDAVIATIRAARDAEAARVALMRQFKLSELQAQAILDMQLRRLAALERERILAELAEVRKQIAYLEDLLAHPVKLLRLIKQDLLELKTRHGDARRTAIVEAEPVELTQEDLIPEQEMVVVVSTRDYVKRLPGDAYRARGRGSRGQMVTSAREDDPTQHLLVTRTHQSVLFFTNQGRVYQVKAHELPEAGRQARGLPLVNLIKLSEGETVTAVLAVPDFGAGAQLVLVTRAGEVKRLALADFATARAGSGLAAMSLPEGDELGWARLTSGQQELILVTAAGQAIRFREDEVRPSARGSGGVRAIRLDDGDRVAGVDVVEPGGELAIITRRGIGKRVRLDEFSTQGRGGGGVRAQATTARTGPVVAARVVTPADDLLLVSAGGFVAQLPVEELSLKSRAAQGAVAMTLSGDDGVVAMARLTPPTPTEAANGHARAAARPARRTASAAGSAPPAAEPRGASRAKKPADEAKPATGKPAEAPRGAAPPGDAPPEKPRRASPRRRAG